MTPFRDWPEIMTPRDVMQHLDYDHVTAYQLFNQPDFPQSKPITKRGKRVGRYALRDYINGREVHDNED